MKILLIKLSSLGDLIHTFPALTDLLTHDPSLEVTWVVESAFAEVPVWHPAVKNIIVAPLRACKNKLFKLSSWRSIYRLFKALRATRYDAIIDAQGLYKSAVLARLARGPRIGFAKGACRENVAWLYTHKIAVLPEQHAIFKLKQLIAEAFFYEVPQAINYGQHQAIEPLSPSEKIAFFAHGTTWVSKHYPDELWRQLVTLATNSGYHVLLPQVNAAELARAEYLAHNEQVEILPKMSLTEIKQVIAQVSVVIAVDTGLAHIAAMLGVPTITLYGPTDPQKIGTLGERQVHLTAVFPCAPCGARVCTHPDRDQKPSPPCFKMLPPEHIWQQAVLLS